MRILFDEAADAIFLARLDGRLVQVNHQACISTGFSRDELLAMSIPDINAEIVSEVEFRFFFEELRPGSVNTVESLHRRKDGSVFPVEITISVLQTPTGPNVMGIARDITERKRAQKENEILESQLRQAQKMEAIGNLAGGIAHDFRNLLQAINGYAEILLLDKEKDDQGLRQAGGHP